MLNFLAQKMSGYKDTFQFTINKMSSDNTAFYHKHIQSNIKRLEQRKDKFINYRLEFLKEYCEPIKQRIDLIHKEIEKYKIMRDTQEQVIENNPQIASIKQQIRNYMQTHSYYEQKVSQYEKRSFQLDEYNCELKKKIIYLRKGIKNHKEELGFRLPNIRKQRHTTNQREKEEKQYNNSLILSNIKSQTEEISTFSYQIRRTPKRRIIGIGQKIQRVQSNNINQYMKIEEKQQGSHLQSAQSKSFLKNKALQLRQKITQFNRTQVLFHECFETKKSSVQKSVSQLQSKLIVNRAQFLNTCQAIGTKTQKVPYQQFEKLSCDEIITLFISFVWLNRKLHSQFVKKRKNIMELLTKLPKIQ